jgi:hypothetical protein
MTSTKRTFTVAETVAQAKQEILADVRSGRLPRDAHSFSDLHDFVDANEYGGLCDPRTVEDLINHLGGYDADGNPPSAWITYANTVQAELDAWLKRGGVIVDFGPLIFKPLQESFYLSHHTIALTCKVRKLTYVISNQNKNNKELTPSLWRSVILAVIDRTVWRELYQQRCASLADAVRIAEIMEQVAALSIEMGELEARGDKSCGR